MPLQQNLSGTNYCNGLSLNPQNILIQKHGLNIITKSSPTYNTRLGEAHLSKSLCLF